MLFISSSSSLHFLVVHVLLHHVISYHVALYQQQTVLFLIWFALYCLTFTPCAVPLVLGHAGMQGSDSVESHFNVRVIASCFEGMSLVLRHKMIYTLLTSEMSNGIHALSIYAKTPTEEANK